MTTAEVVIVLVLAVALACLAWSRWGWRDR